MRTEDLIAALAADAAPIAPGAADRLFLARLAGAGAAALAAMFLVFGARPDLGAAALLPTFWLKLAFTGTAMLAAVVTLRRLGHPGMSTRLAPLALAAPVLLVWALATAALLAADPGSRLSLVLGATWAECSRNIALLSLPAAVLSFRAIRGLAPTRPALAGGAAGLFAGAVAALVYSLHCPEADAPFIAVWYVLGMGLPAAAGALAGPRLLRW